jgi:hypothetical protein
MLPPPRRSPPAPTPAQTGPVLQPAAAWQKASNTPLFDAVRLLPPREIVPVALTGIAGL